MGSTVNRGHCFFLDQLMPILIIFSAVPLARSCLIYRIVKSSSLSSRQFNVQVDQLPTVKVQMARGGQSSYENRP